MGKVLKSKDLICRSRRETVDLSLWHIFLISPKSFIHACGRVKYGSDSYMRQAAVFHICGRAVRKSFYSALIDIVCAGSSLDFKI